MIENIKNKIWDLLKEKKVSLVMLYDPQGNILWHKGRKITGKSVKDGGGFSKSYIKRAFTQDELMDTDVIIVEGAIGPLTKSMNYLKLRSLIIKRIAGDYYLYIDSGTKSSFSPEECESFRVMGEILGETIYRIKEHGGGRGGLVGSSDATKRTRELVVTYSMTDDPVLLTGETGTGKSHTAQLIHDYSGRKGNFKLIHTPGIPENLFESEMFGYRKGAFTDAAYDKKGLVEEADGGTLFIDEITEVSVALQAKLLRFIGTGKFTRLGESTEREVDVRIVAASNRNLTNAINENLFREDLFYRLSVFEIYLPPLRERKDDIEALVLDKQSYLKGKKMGSGFWEAIREYHWPGNVRELFSLLKRAGVHPADIVTGQDIRSIIGERFDDAPAKPAAGKVDLIWDSFSRGQCFWDVVKKPFLSRDLNRDEVKALISRGLVETGGRYNQLLKIFNMEENDYHRFMRFLHSQELLPVTRSSDRRG